MRLPRRNDYVKVTAGSYSGHEGLVVRATPEPDRSGLMCEVDIAGVGTVPIHSKFLVLDR